MLPDVVFSSSFFDKKKFLKSIMYVYHPNILKGILFNANIYF